MDWHKHLEQCSAYETQINVLRAENERLKAELEEAKQWEEAVVESCMVVESCLSKDPRQTLKNLEGYWWNDGEDHGKLITETDLVLKLREELELLRSQQAVVPAGYKLVPVEPTPEMRKAGFDEGYEETDGWAYASPLETYRAMLAAAPEAPQPSQQAEPVVEFIEDAKAVGGARFKFLRPLRVGTKLYTAPPGEDARDAALKLSRNALVQWNYAALRYAAIEAIDAAMQKGIK